MKYCLLWIAAKLLRFAIWANNHCWETRQIDAREYQKNRKELLEMKEDFKKQLDL